MEPENDTRKESRAEIHRRCFIGAAGAALAGALPGRKLAAAATRTEGPSPNEKKETPLRLGLVTYNLAKDWDVATIIKNCADTGFEGVELRTTHAHRVEVALGPEERREVRKRFEDSPVELASLGSAFEFHSADPAEVRRNIDGAREYAKLAADVGAKGIKVRPNGIPRGASEDAVLRQIGQALAEVGDGARAAGVEVRVEVHGNVTSRLPVMKKIMDLAAHDNVFVCWNSNPTDLEDGGFEANFELVKDRIRFVHMRDLYIEDYPFRKLLGALRRMGYSGYSCAEIPESKDPVRVMRYYRGLFRAYQDLL
jgi:sugar phosphate isomerase/epimerase